MSRKRKRLTRKHRRSTAALLHHNAPLPRHRLTAGRTGKVHAIKNKSRRPSRSENP